jgi:Uma2 family endonuclease
MSLTARKYRRLSAAEYLAAENDGSWRHEFINGAVFAMAAASRWHNLIRNQLVARLMGHVSGDCSVFGGEMKLQIETNNDERYYYPDVFVSCDPNDRELYSCSTAVLVVEVLSPGTERIDRFEKFEAYKSIPSLLEYGLLTQDAMELELFRRCTDWQREFYQRDNTVTFESVGLTINVSSLYRGVDFDDPAPPPGT